MKIFTAFTREELDRLQFPIVVELWGRHKEGRVKREYLKTFTEDERKKIARYYPIFYKWYLRTGTPELYQMKISTYQLLERAVNFFATV